KGEDLKSEDSAADSVSKVGRVLILLLLVIWGLSFVWGYSNSVLVLNVIGLLFAIVGLRFPGIGLLGIGLLCTLDPLTRNLLLSGGLWRWNTLNYWLLIVILLNLRLVLRLSDPNTRWLEVFWGIMFLMLPLSVYLDDGLQDLLNVGATFGILIYFTKAWRLSNVYYWQGVINGIAGVLGGIAFYLQLGHLPYINPNSWAAFPMTALFSIALALPTASGVRRGRPLLLLLAAVNIVWVFLTGSRGSLLTALVVVIYYMLTLKNAFWTTVFLIAGSIAVFWASNLLWDRETYALNRIQRLFDPTYTLAERTSGRSDIAATGLKIFQQRPLGIGTGSFRAGATLLNIQGGAARPAHSGWIKTLAENGIQGIIVMTIMVSSFLINGWKSREGSRFAVGFLVTVVLAVSFVSKEFQGKDLWYLVAGAIPLLNPNHLITNLQASLPKRARRGTRQVRI
ncbi:MAG: O-antigen ligase family protein, partial [Anaerolineales bacterium]|nr:O-antigen ligase family protein [Anaerolineales bacterium]